MAEKPVEHVVHRYPSRRRFLQNAAAATAAFTMAPYACGRRSNLDVVSKGLAGDLIPFLVFDMEGGGALPANFLVGGAGGPQDLLGSYNKLGWDPKTDPLDATMGLPMGSTVSGLYQGLVATASADARARFRMGSLCHFADIDTSTNQLSAIQLAADAGAQGLIIQKRLGNRNRPSGGNSDVARNTAVGTPLFVQNVDDLTSAVSFGAAFDKFSDDSLTRYAKAARDLSAGQFAKLPSTPEGDRLRELASKAYETNLGYTGDLSALIDPRQNGIMQGIYGIDPGTQASAEAAINAGVVYNVLLGNSGPGCITLANCDYHDGTSTTGDQRDRQMGEIIGRAIEAAHQLQRPLFFQLITDGGCDNQTGTRLWVSDNAGTCMTVIGYYSPQGPREQVRTQIGRFTPGQVADQATLIGGTPAKAAFACFANYLHLHGALGEFASYAPADLFTPAQLDSLMVFA